MTSKSVKMIKYKRVNEEVGSPKVWGWNASRKLLCRLGMKMLAGGSGFLRFSQFKYSIPSKSICHI